LQIQNDSFVTVENSFISYCNTSTFGITNSGGAVYIFNAKATFLNVQFESNSAGVGGAVFINHTNGMDAVSLFHDCTFHNNSASNWGGALVVVHYGTANITDVCGVG
jgi:hypothetical protein